MQEVIDETITYEKVTIKCDKCGGDGAISTITLRFSKNPTEVISIFKCKKCGLNERLCFDDMKRCDKSVKIVAKLDSADELSRFILFPKEAVANFYDNDDQLLFSISRPSTVVTTIGSLIEVRMEFFADCGCISESKIDNSLCTHASQICENSELGKSIALMKECVKNPQMTLIIDDPTGNCRIGKPKREFPESLYCNDLEVYNDEKVQHEFIKKKQDVE